MKNAPKELHVRTTVPVEIFGVSIERALIDIADAAVNWHSEYGEDGLPAPVVGAINRYKELCNG